MKKNFNHFISMFVLIIFLIMAWACDETSYPAPDPWTQECSFFTPFTVQYEVTFNVSDKKIIPLSNAMVTCKVIGHRRLSHPIFQDTCYWNEFIDTTLIGISDVNGKLIKNFDFTYASVGDYFILEISTEKTGYNPGLISGDYRWQYFERKWIRSNIDVGPDVREDVAYTTITAININP